MDNRAVMKQILDKIESYGSILISRHKRPDGDAVGSTRGLQEILRASYPEKEVHIVSEDYAERMAFLHDEHYAPDDDTLRRSLLIVIDTAGTNRISNSRWSLAKELIKIDHHIDITPYGDIAWVEDWRSSACEMVAYFALSFPERLRLSPAAAFCLYTGMVTDSGRFQYEGVTGDTLRIAAALLDVGIDTEQLFAELYMDELAVLRFKAYVYEHIEQSEHGVAYFCADRAMQQRFGLSFEDTCACISYLSTIRGSLIYLAFIEDETGALRVRLRSRFLTVNALAERYGGGGHACAAGATVHGNEQMLALVADADALLKEYKESHEGWL